MRSLTVTILRSCFSQNVAQAVAAHHRAVVGHDLADHAGRVEPGHARQVDRGFGLAGPHQHAALAGAQRKGVAGAQEVGRAGAGVDQPLDRVGPVVGRDAGRHPAARLDRDRERGPHRGRVVADHVGDVQLVQPLGGERHADQAAALLAHEVDRLGGHLLGRHHEVALVLAVLVVHDDDHLALADVGNRRLDRIHLTPFRCQPLPEPGKRRSERSDGPIRRLAPPAAQQRDRGLGQTGPLGQLGRRHPGLGHRRPQLVRKTLHGP